MLHGFHAAAVACSWVQRTSVPSTHMRCMITANPACQGPRSPFSSRGPWASALPRLRARTISTAACSELLRSMTRSLSSPQREIFCRSDRPRTLDSACVAVKRERRRVKRRAVQCDHWWPSNRASKRSGANPFWTIIVAAPNHATARATDAFDRLHVEFSNTSSRPIWLLALTSCRGTGLPLCPCRVSITAPCSAMMAA